MNRAGLTSAGKEFHPIVGTTSEETDQSLMDYYRTFLGPVADQPEGEEIQDDLETEFLDACSSSLQVRRNTNEEPQRKPKPADHYLMNAGRAEPLKQELGIGKSPISPALKRRYRKATFDLGTPVVESAGMPHQPSPASMRNQMEALSGGEATCKEISQQGETVIHPDCSLPSKKPSLEELVLEGTVTTTVHD